MNSNFSLLRKKEIIEILDGDTQIEENDEIVLLAKKVLANMNITAKTGSTGGGSDTNVLNKNGIKAVNLGIGMKKAHTLEEYIAIEDIYNSAIMVTEIIKEARCVFLRK